MTKKRNYHNHSHIKAYKASSVSDKNKIKRRIDKYMNDPDITLSDLGLEIGEILNHEYDRKKVASLIEFLGLEPRSKEISHQSRVKSINETHSKQRELYMENSKKILYDNGGTKETFISEWYSQPYTYFQNKYSLSQHQTASLVEKWGA